MGTIHTSKPETFSPRIGAGCFVNSPLCRSRCSYMSCPLCSIPIPVRFHSWWISFFWNSFHWSSRKTLFWHKPSSYLSCRSWVNWWHWCSKTKSSHSQSYWSCSLPWITAFCTHCFRTTAFRKIEKTNSYPSWSSWIHPLPGRCISLFFLVSDRASVASRTSLWPVLQKGKVRGLETGR